MAIATGTALLIGAGVSAGVGIYGANKQAQTAKDAQKQQAKAQEAELGFAQEQQAKWESVFGPIQENLSRYYQNLSPDAVAARGVQQFEQERTTALERTRETLAQRGLSTSGVSAAVEMASEFQGAEGRAQIRAEAPMQAAREKLGFLQVGLGANPTAQTANTLGRHTQYQANNAANAQQRADQASEMATTAVMGAAQAGLDYFTDPEL